VEVESGESGQVGRQCSCNGMSVHLLAQDDLKKERLLGGGGSRGVVSSLGL